VDAGSVSLRHAPSKPREPGIIAIEGDPLAAGLYGQSSEPCIRHQVASDLRLHAKAHKDLPMTVARLNDDAVGLTHQDVTEMEHLLHPARFHENLGVGGDADHPAQYLWSDPVTRIAVDHAIEPEPARMLTSGRIMARSWPLPSHRNG